MTNLPPFQVLIDAHASEIHRFLLAIAGPNAADDCLQETWISALRAYPRLRPDSNPRAWLFTIARRKVIDHARAARRAPVPVQVQDLPPRPASDPEPDGELWARVRELPAKQRSAIGLRFVADLSHAEIAAVMGTSEEAARRSVFEGLRRLRRELDGDDR